MHTPASLDGTRRRLLAMGASRLAAATGLAVLHRAAAALPLRTLAFPRDRGAHPDFKTEWWYITGQASTAGGRLFGFQLTFFRSRVEGTQSMASRFAAKQLLFAHAAITDVQGHRLWHDQRIARSGFGVADASDADMAVKLRDWQLTGRGTQHRASLPAADFAIALDFAETQPVLLQGDRGLSRKGPDERQASYYYSQPQLKAAGRLRIKGEAFEVAGKAWLDHEWSDEYLAPGAAGWDWIGMNLDDGSALTAFRLRDQAGSALWDGGSFRSGSGAFTSFRRGDVTFTAGRSWKSPLTQTAYPVEWKVSTPGDDYTVKALIDDQELDSRPSTGAVYWEGLSELVDSGGKRVGIGYLEMTGYAGVLRM